MLFQVNNIWSIRRYSDLKSVASFGRFKWEMKHNTWTVLSVISPLYRIDYGQSLISTLNETSWSIWEYKICSVQWSCVPMSFPNQSPNIYYFLYKKNGMRCYNEWWTDVVHDEYNSKLKNIFAVELYEFRVESIDEWTGSSRI